MIKYPKIPDTAGFAHNKCIAFVKLDGSNIAATWNKKQGFYKFGLRSRLFDKTDPNFGSAIDIFNNTIAEPLNKLFSDNQKFKNDNQVTVFGEFFGPSTFAGNHYNLPKNEIRTIKIFDIYKENFGFIGPENFISLMKNIVPIPDPVYKGKFTGQLVEDIRNGKFKDKGVVEGVVIKAGKGGDDIEYAKIKTNEYLLKLKNVFGNNWKNYWE